ncbi:hypothetical protein N1495_00370 [Streptococcus didelphis]|uniref:hypothetical protein n=1 Tax=Streptococcus didelphis TaxID=102886 RepID=UPI0027D2BA4A|nr:hypothetical protein [Streptococcus didelphis]WMB29563.1 hypothetical protein N1495_00370 [Streptococcus didelphis]
MRNRFKGKDYLAFKDMTREEIEFITDLSLEFKKKWTAKEPHDYLKGQVWAALFEKIRLELEMLLKEQQPT